MPRNVRNFWLSLRVDGRATPIETGPASADGGFDLTILMREEGAVSEKRLRIRGVPLSDGTLYLETITEPGEARLTLRTRR